MSLTDEDIKKLERLIDRKMDDRFRQKGISGQYREIKAEIHKTQSEIVAEEADARFGMERIIMSVLQKQDEKLDTLTRSIPPLAQKLADTESAAVVAGKNGIAANGNATDAKLAANEGKRVSKRNFWLLLAQPPIIITILEIIEHLLK